MNNQYLESMLFESDYDPIGLPQGVLFMHHDDVKKQDKLMHKISHEYENCGYIKVIPPLFEYYETFEKGSGKDIARRSFCFKDKEGQLLALRYDMTTPIARMIAMRKQEDKLPLKYYYCEDVFREQPLHKGKMRQIKQVGIEYIGSDDILSDGEVVRLLGQSLETIEPDYTLVLGDVSLYRHILSKLELSEMQSQAIHSCFNRKDTVSLAKILEKVSGKAETKEFLLSLTGYTGHSDEVYQALRRNNPTAYQEAERLFKIIGLLPESVRKHIIVDLGLIKDFTYYTSLTMEGFTKSAGHAVAHGGRYDELYQAFGKNYPATGFAIHLNF